MSHARKVVAIVEDEAAVRRSLVRLLRARGIESESFANGEKFLRYLGVCRPDCVILEPVTNIVAVPASRKQINDLDRGRHLMQRLGEPSGHACGRAHQRREE